MRDRTLARWLVRTYPRSLREPLGADLADAIVDRLRAHRDAGGSPLAGMAAAVRDTLRNAPAAWLQAAIAAARDRRPLRTSSAQLDPERRTMVDKLRQDLRYALRAWLRRPGLALVAIATLALGIGVNTALFSIVNVVLLKPLPFRFADRLIAIWGRTPTSPQTLVSYPEFQAFRRQSRAFEGVGIWLPQSVNLTGAEQPQRITGTFVSSTFFDVVGLAAERGRLFTEAESEPGTATMTAVITHDFWQQHFNGDPAALGASLTLNGLPLTVVGILAEPFDPTRAPGGGYMIDSDVFIPAAHLPVPNGIEKAGPAFLAIGRLAPAATLEQGRADLDVIARRLEAIDPVAQRDRTTNLITLQETIVGSTRAPLLLLLASVGVVLLIACVNVGNLLMARAVDRQREIAVRAALGASQAAVLRQLLVEALVLATGAGVLGLVIGRWALQTLTWLRPPSVPIPDHVPLDATVLSFTGLIALLVALACGLAPAVQLARPDLSHALRAGGRRASGPGRRLRDSLVVAEVAMSVALVALSALLIQSMFAMQRVDLGFDPSNVFTLQFRLPATKYQSPEAIGRFFRTTLERVSAAPGVASAALVRRVPFSGNRGDTPMTIEGRPTEKGREPLAGYNLVTPGYFRTMRIPLFSGRDFTDRDDLKAPPVIVVNRTLAKTVWGSDDPIGRRLRIPELPDWATVVGVVGDVKHLGPADPPHPQLYISHYQSPMIFSSLVARTTVPPMNVANDVRRAIWSVDKDQPVWSVAPLDTIVGRAQGSTKFLASLLTVFGAVALAMAAVGVYGVMAYSVTERTREIGIRLALGASASRVRREVVVRGLLLTGAAVGIGQAGAVAAARAAANTLFAVKPADPVALAAAAVVLGGVSLMACYIPARRASRVDPVVALSEE